MTNEFENNVDLRDLVVQEGLFKLYDQMFEEVDIVSVLRHTTEAVRQIFDAERATTYLVLKNTQELESAAVVGNVSRTIRIPISEDSLAGYCALTGRPFVIADAYKELDNIDPNLHFDKSWDEMNQYHTRDVMCTPAVFKDEVMGVVQVINSRRGVFQEADLIALQSVSRFVAYTLHYARLYDELATLQCLEKERAEFMRIIVHEFRSPVVASKALASALKYTNRENQELTSVLTRIENRMGQLLDLVEDVLHLSRIKSGSPLGEITICDLAAETRTGCQPYLDEAETKGLLMTVNLPELPVFVRIDRQGYQLILSNLVSNAVKYTSATGSVEITLQQKGLWAVLEVKDTGLGIPEDDIPKLFTEFFRAANARRSKIKGTGVGLAGVKQIVERFKGELELVSQENKGSTFTVRLPLYSVQN